MTVADTAPRSEAGEPNEFGYRSFTLGQFEFSRDEYFAYVNWPTGRHVISVDAFLRALQRDVAWEFFYGIVNFDGVVGTVNHYGTVDLFAGRYNDAYRRAELDHVENIETPVMAILSRGRSVICSGTRGQASAASGIRSWSVCGGTCEPSDGTSVAVSPACRKSGVAL